MTKLIIFSLTHPQNQNKYLTGVFKRIPQYENHIVLLHSTMEPGQ